MTSTPPVREVDITFERGERDRKRLKWILAALLTGIAVTLALVILYLIRPAPLPDLLPLGVNYPPRYVFSIYEVDEPIGVALSPDGGTVYVAESGGERLIKAFDREGNLLRAFAAPNTTQFNRSPMYLATDGIGRLYVSDRLQGVIFVFSADGEFLDSLIDPDTSLAEYIATTECGTEAGTEFSFDVFEQVVRCKPPGGAELMLDAPTVDGWSPLGVRVDAAGKFLITDLFGNQHRVRVQAGGALAGLEPADVELVPLTDNRSGQASNQFLFPNVAVTDDAGNVYVTDGNNGRVSVWDSGGTFLYNIGTGAGEGAVFLPRGAAIDRKSRLHVVDAVGHDVKVFDVGGDSAAFLFTFGEEGIEDGQFNFPNDIAIDAGGRLYVADRVSNRIQVWSY